MIPTDSDYLSTVNVEQLRTDVLKDMFEDMCIKYVKLCDEMIMISKELKRRKTCTL